MEHSHIVKTLFCRTRKARMLGVLQLAVCPTLSAVIILYLKRNALPSDAVEPIQLALFLFFVTFALLGYGAGPAVLPKNALQKFSRANADKIRLHVQTLIDQIQQTILEKERSIAELKELYF